MTDQSPARAWIAETLDADGTRFKPIVHARKEPREDNPAMGGSCTRAECGVWVKWYAHRGTRYDGLVMLPIDTPDMLAILSEDDLRLLIAGLIPDLPTCAARDSRDGMPVSLNYGDQSRLAEGRVPDWLRFRAVEAVETGLLRFRIAMSVRAKEGHHRAAMGVGTVFALGDGQVSVGFPSGATWSAQPGDLDVVSVA